MLHPMRRDHLAGLFMVIVGLGVLTNAMQYAIGTMTNIGPGFMLVVLGVILTLLGIGIALGAGPDEAADAHTLHAAPSVRGWACIVASVLLFILLAYCAGLVPATFICVLVAAFADRAARLGSSLLLASLITVVGVLVFHYGLAVQIPLFQTVWP